jgi:hypothetical protein
VARRVHYLTGEADERVTTRDGVDGSGEEAAVAIPADLRQLRPHQRAEAHLAARRHPAHLPFSWYVLAPSLGCSLRFLSQVGREGVSSLRSDLLESGPGQCPSSFLFKQFRWESSPISIDSDWLLAGCADICLDWLLDLIIGHDIASVAVCLSELAARFFPFGIICDLLYVVLDTPSMPLSFCLQQRIGN